MDSITECLKSHLMVVMMTDHLLGHFNVGIFNALLVPCQWTYGICDLTGFSSVQANFKQIIFFAIYEIGQLNKTIVFMLPYVVLMIQPKCKVPSLVHYIM